MVFAFLDDVSGAGNMLLAKQVLETYVRLAKLVRIVQKPQKTMSFSASLSIHYV